MGVVETARKGSGTTYSFTQSYGYDHLNRLNAASDTGGWTQNFSFDRYGNPWTTTNSGLPLDRLPSSNVYNAANNQSGFSQTQYDTGGVGNQVVMGSSTLTFDAENRILQNYDASGGLRNSPRGPRSQTAPADAYAVAFAYCKATQ